MPRKKAEVEGQLTLSLEPEEPKKILQKKPRMTQKKIRELTEYTTQNNGTSIGNLMRVFHYSSTEATICFDKLVEVGVVDGKGMLVKKKKEWVAKG